MEGFLLEGGEGGVAKEGADCTALQFRSQEEQYLHVPYVCAVWQIMRKIHKPSCNIKLYMC